MSEWDQYANEWDTNESVAEYSKIAFSTLEKYLNIKDIKWKSSRILDFGCGTGHLSKRLSPYVKEIVAIDSSKKMIEVFERKEIENIKTKACYLDEKLAASDPLFTKKFDLIISSSVCGFLPNFPETLSVLKSLLVDGGSFVQWDWFLSQESEAPGFTLEQVKLAYEGCGLNIVHLEKEFLMTNQGENMDVLMGIGRK